MIEFVLQTFLGCLAGFGWFFCLGHLLVEKFAPKFSGYAFIFSISFASAAAFLALITPWIAFPAPIPLILGFWLVGIWFWKKPMLPAFPKIEWTPTFAFTVSILIIYAIIVVFFGEIGFDARSYYVPFIQEFAAYGQISLPPNAINWVDHVHYVFPKAVHIALGLSNQLVQGSYVLIKFLVLAALAVLLNQLAVQFGVKDKWISSALFFLPPIMLVISKQFYIETAIFLWFLSFLILLVNQQKVERGELVLVFILTVAITMAKLNSFIFIFSTACVLLFYSKKVGAFFSILSGIILGEIGNFLFPFFSGVDLIHEFQIVQAIDTAIYVNFLDRIMLVSWSVQHLLIPTVIGAGLILSLVLAVVDRRARLYCAILLWSFLSFAVAYFFSNLYHLTYAAFALNYVYAFIGIAVFSIPLFFQRIEEQFNSKLPNIIFLFLIFLLFLSSTFYSFAIIQKFQDKNSFIWGNYYPIVENIPNSPRSVVLFMNNINPITVGLERATIYDYTTFPVMAGNPCEFWHLNAITHVVYYVPYRTTFQLDRGNPDFYKKSLEDLMAGTCSTIVFNNSFQLIARVN